MDGKQLAPITNTLPEFLHQATPQAVEPLSTTKHNMTDHVLIYLRLVESKFQAVSFLSNYLSSCLHSVFALRPAPGHS